MARKTVSQAECLERREGCGELSRERRGRIRDDIKALRREIRLGFTLTSLFISVLAILIKAGVI